MITDLNAPFTLLAQAPTMDGMYFLLLTSRVLHMLGAAILLGGLIYVRHVIQPPVPAGAGASADAYFGGKRARWAKWIGIATFLLLVSGLLNYFYILSAMDRMAKPYHMLAGIKILLSFVLFFLAALLAGKTAAAEKLREKFTTWLTICVLIGIAIVILGSVLRTFDHRRKVEGDRVTPVAASAPTNVVTSLS
jgi:putative copper export protein